MVDNATILSNMVEGLQDARWRETVLEEMRAADKNGTLEIVDLKE